MRSRVLTDLKRGAVLLAVIAMTLVTVRIEADTDGEQKGPLRPSYSPGVFSLSHVALPFPLSDGLYGLEPDPDDDFGITRGAIAPRGEHGALMVSLDALLRMSSNPFFPTCSSEPRKASVRRLGQRRHRARA